MQGIFQKENTDKALKYGIYRHLPTYEKIIRNLVSFCCKKQIRINTRKGGKTKNQKRKEAKRTGETKRKNLVTDIWKLF